MNPENDLTKTLDTCNQIYKMYKDLLNAYVLDFYVENHWQKLSESWRNFLSTQGTHEIADLLKTSGHVKTLYPLSLLCLRQIIKINSIPRDNICIPEKAKTSKEHAFTKVFWKNVKQKKQHEIDLMSRICYNSSLKTECKFIVDVGSGVGHLSRMLALGYDFRVCAIEADYSLYQLALKLNSAQYRKQFRLEEGYPIRHIHKRIDYDISVNNFLSLVIHSFQVEDLHNFKFGIVGLHPCGNLATTLLRLYAECPNIVFINIASCCYMKLSLDKQLTKGFPISTYCNLKEFELTYNSCEIACHAIENYVEKLKNPTEFHSLKIHAYRAALEKQLVSINKEYKHHSVANVKYKNDLSFKEYCDLALKKTDIVIQHNIDKTQEEISKTWHQVVYFYSIRLMLAPLVETLILYDRLLFLKESKKSECSVLPVFDCRISPRNHVLCATKSS